jgi:hypothetical protein
MLIVEDVEKKKIFPQNSYQRKVFSNDTMHRTILNKAGSTQKYISIAVLHAFELGIDIF